MSHFDETSGAVASRTGWGHWSQTMEEVTIEINVPDGTSGKQVKCSITSKSITVAVNGEIILKGEFPSSVKADDSVWTVEDKKLVRICLPKVKSTADQCWKSLLKCQYEADTYTLDEMQKKLTLQRYQFENPGMDFSSAEITGNYQKGGPELPGS